MLLCLFQVQFCWALHKDTYSLYSIFNLCRAWLFLHPTTMYLSLRLALVASYYVLSQLQPTLPQNLLLSLVSAPGFSLGRYFCTIYAGPDSCCILRSINCHARLLLHSIMYLLNHNLRQSMPHSTLVASYYVLSQLQPTSRQNLLLSLVSAPGFSLGRCTVSTRTYVAPESFSVIVVHARFFSW
jgi:hypothetical protein